jgi:hypothetical protein
MALCTATATVTATVNSNNSRKENKERKMPQGSIMISFTWALDYSLDVLTNHVSLKLN